MKTLFPSRGMLSRHKRQLPMKIQLKMFSSTCSFQLKEIEKHYTSQAKIFYLQYPGQKVCIWYNERKKMFDIAAAAGMAHSQKPRSENQY